MKRTRLLALAGLLAAAIAVIGAARQDKDPEAAVREINAWYSEQLQLARGDGKPLTLAVVQKLSKERDDKVKAALEGMDVAKTAPEKCLALAQLYQMSRMPKEQLAAAERFLTSQPATEPKFTAQMLMLGGYSSQSDADSIVKLLHEMKPPTPALSGSLASSTAGLYASLVAAKKGPDAGLELLKLADQWAAAAPEAPANARQTPPSATIAMARYRLLLSAQKPADALAALDEAEKKLPAESPLLTTFALYRSRALVDQGKTNDALAALEAGAAKLPADSPNRANLALERASILEKAGRQQDALAVLKEARAKVADGSSAARSIDSKLKLATLVGSVAPEVKADKAFGEYHGLESLKGKVVVLDFFAHW